MQKSTESPFLSKPNPLSAGGLLENPVPQGTPSDENFMFHVEDVLGGSCKLQVNQYLFSKVKPHLDAVWGNLIVGFGKTPQSILLSGTSFGEGASTVAESLSLYLAQEYGYRVLYVHGSGGKKADTRLLNSKASDDALNEVLFEGRDLSTLVIPSNVTGLSFLPFSHSNSKLVQASISQHPEILRKFMDYTKQHFNVVVFNCQPVTVAPWTVSIAQYLDAVLLVCSYASSRREVARSCIETFASGGVRVNGMVLNERRYPVPAQLYRLMK